MRFCKEWHHESSTGRRSYYDYEASHILISASCPLYRAISLSGNTPDDRSDDFLAGAPVAADCTTLSEFRADTAISATLLLTIENCRGVAASSFIKIGLAKLALVVDLLARPQPRYLEISSSLGKLKLSLRVEQIVGHI